MASLLPSREASTPLLPHTFSLCVWLHPPEPRGFSSRVRAARTRTRLSLSTVGNPSSGRGNTITHAARQAATGYRKAEIDNAGGPPAPYPNLDTRPALAPGSFRRDPARSASTYPQLSPILPMHRLSRISTSWHRLRT